MSHHSYSSSSETENELDGPVYLPSTMKTVFLPSPVRTPVSSSSSHDSEEDTKPPMTELVQHTHKMEHVHIFDHNFNVSVPDADVKVTTSFNVLLLFATAYVAGFAFAAGGICASRLLD